eukprot:gb/GEZN01003396.1/.p1 GENE.gb/GEZN01003396.1/~~gb/GEZN01003396.1/.p1  ORF type:complete len:628 (-),score=66.36 gb/GEZN01003396.1/:303-2090(-)
MSSARRDYMISILLSQVTGSFGKSADAAPVSSVANLARNFQAMATQKSWVYLLYVILQLVAHFGVVWFAWKTVRALIKMFLLRIERFRGRPTGSTVANSGKTLGNPKTKKIKVLMLSESAPPQINGIARRVGCYVESLSELGHTVVEYSPRINEHAHDFPNLWQLGNKMMVVKLPAYIAALSQDWDVVHAVLPLNLSTFFFFQGFLTKYWLTGKRPVLVSSWHCNIADYVPRFMPRRTPQWVIDTLIFSMMFITKAMLGMSDRLLLPTLATEPALTRLMPEVPLGVCHTGVSDKEFSGHWKDSEQGKEWAKLKKQDLVDHKCHKVLLYVGRFSPEKSLDKLIVALERLNDDALPDHRCMLWLVGHGPLEISINKQVQAKKLPVRFCGFQTGSGLSSVYTAGDVFVSASLTETFGQTVSEALASGLNVAIPRTDCFDAAFGQFPHAVKLWEMNDDADMVRAIKEACWNDNDTAGHRDPVPNWKQATAKVVDEYREAAVTKAKRQSCAEAYMCSLPWTPFYGLGELLLWLVTMLESCFSRGDQHKNRRGMIAANIIFMFSSIAIAIYFVAGMWAVSSWMLKCVGWPLATLFPRLPLA